MAKNVQLNLKITDLLKKKLEEITAKDNRSQTMEIEWLIERRHSEIVSACTK